MQPKTLFGSRQESHLCHGSGNKKTSNSGVKTPALLFYKPGNGNIQKSKPILLGNENGNLFASSDSKCAKNTNASQLPHKGEHWCENHTNIPAKYVSRTEDQEEQIYYCDLCAQLLIQQGFQVAALPNLSCGYSQYKGYAPTKKKSVESSINKRGNSTQVYPFPERQQQIQQFLSNLKEAKQEINQSHAQVRDILINSQQFYGQQIQQINQYFQTVMQSLELEKNKCYNHILLERRNAEKEARHTIQILSDGEKELASMMADIEQNLDSVYSISWHNYKLVMDAFQCRMSEVDKVISEVKQRGIMDVEYRKIEFAGVPQSINSLSEIIIQNSYGSVPEGDGTLLLTQECCSSISKNQSLSGNQPEISIFQKLKTDHSSDSELREHPNHMMFSFDAEKMKLVNNIQNDENQNQENNQSTFEEGVAIKLRKNKRSISGLYKYDFPDRVQGIKQVEELDVVVLDDDGFMSVPPNVKLAR